MSSSEKALLNQELDTIEDKDKIGSFIEDVELMGNHEEIVARARQKIEALEAGLAEKVKEITPPVENSDIQNEQIVEKGGSPEVAEERTASVDENIARKDEEINEFKQQTEEKIEGVKNNESNSKEQTENSTIDQEKNKITSEFATKLYAHNIEGAVALLGQLEEKDRASVAGIIAEHLRVNNMRQGGETSSAKTLEQLSGLVSPEVLENAKSIALFDETTYDSVNPIPAIKKAQETYGVSNEDISSAFAKGAELRAEDMKKSQEKELADWDADFQLKIENAKDEGSKEKLRTELKNKIGEKQKEFKEKNEEYSRWTKEKIAETEKKMEKTIKALDLEISGLLDEISSKLPDQMKSLVNSESYKKLIDLHEKRQVEEKALFDIYDTATKGHDDHRRSFHIGQGSTEQYAQDLKALNAPSDSIKRFEDYVSKFRKPEVDAGEAFEDEYQATITKDRWAFEAALVAKSDEVFGKKNTRDKEEFKKKHFDMYHSNYNKIQGESIPNKELHINTLGKIYS